MSSEADREPDPSTRRSSLRRVISSTREFFDHIITTGRAHSPLADDKLEAADEAVSSVIHSGYQSVKRIAVQGDPAVILSLTAIAAAVPSLPFGARAIIRNAGLAIALTGVMIYPDHLKTMFDSRSTSASPQKE